MRRIIVVALCAVTPLAIALPTLPWVHQPKSPTGTDQQPSLLCQWLPFLCAR